MMDGLATRSTFLVNAARNFSINFGAYLEDYVSLIIIIATIKNLHFEPLCACT
jgi:hypothetical protein